MSWNKRAAADPGDGAHLAETQRTVDVDCIDFVFAVFDIKIQTVFVSVHKQKGFR